MVDLEKTNFERENSKKRLRRRKRGMNLYGFIVILLVLTVGITVSYTFLFNISQIYVTGESEIYSGEEVVAASGIKEGDNLLRLNPEKCEQKILDNLLYVETAEVTRKFPSSLEISVTKCIPAYNVVYENGTLLVSRQGKILGDNAFITEGLPVFYNYSPLEKTPGRQITSTVEKKDVAFREFMRIINNTEQNIISSVDLQDEHSIIVNYSNGIVFKMGNWTDIEYKLNLARDVMNDDDVQGKTGFITMIGDNQCSFRTTDQPGFIPGVTQQPANSLTGDSAVQVPTEPVTDENGETVTEYVDEQDELFREHNEQLTEPSEENETSG